MITLTVKQSSQSFNFIGEADSRKCWIPKVKPLATVLQPPLKQQYLEDISELVKLSQSKMPVGYASCSIGDNLTQCLQAVKPLATVLQPPRKQQHLEDISELAKLFQSKMAVDSVVLQAEFHNFVSYVQKTKMLLT